MKNLEADKTLPSARADKSGIEHNSFLNDSTEMVAGQKSDRLPPITQQRRVTAAGVNVLDQGQSGVSESNFMTGNGRNAMIPDSAGATVTSAKPALVMNPEQEASYMTINDPDD